MAVASMVLVSPRPEVPVRLLGGYRAAIPASAPADAGSAASPGPGNTARGPSGDPAQVQVRAQTQTQAQVRARTRQTWAWPLGGRPRVTRGFAPPPQPWLAGHRGVDLAGEPGAPVLAAGAGVVAFAGMVAGRGVVSVVHQGGLRTTYEPVTPWVRTGESVRAAGTVLGLLVGGHLGCDRAGCLHWGLRLGEVYLDPLLLVGLGRVRLKPLAEGGS